MKVYVVEGWLWYDNELMDAWVEGVYASRDQAVAWIKEHKEHNHANGELNSKGYRVSEKEVIK